MGRRSEYQPKGGDALRLKAVKARVWVADKTVYPLVTHGPYLSALVVVLPIIRRYTNNQITLTFTLSSVCFAVLF